MVSIFVQLNKGNLLFSSVLKSWCSKENLYFFAAFAALRDIISRKAAKAAKIDQRRNYPKIFTPQI